MKAITLHLLLIFCITISSAQELKHATSNWEFSSDEKLTWSSDFPHTKGHYWLRTKVTIHQAGSPQIPYGVGVSMLASTKVYWDGKLIGKNGEIGKSKKTEEVGKMMSIHLVPNKELDAGEHEITVEFSNFNSNKFRIYAADLYNYDETLQNPIILTAYVHIYAGLFLIIGLFYLFRFTIDKKAITSLLFSLLCLFFFSLIIVEYVKNYYNYPHTFHFVRLQIIYAITLTISLLLPSFFLYRLEIPKKRIWIIISLMIILPFIFTIQYGYDMATNLSMIVGFFIATIVCAYALFLGKKDARLLFFTILPIPFILLFWGQYYDVSLYIGFGFLIIVNLISLALKDRENQKVKEEALLVSSRLQMELLKKNIQPHFINNSITSAIDWMERNPQKGIDLLFALSKEFDILNDISERKLIPIMKEIELCKAHLEIMSYRKEEEYELICKNIDEHDVIPPAIFLTIVENGISHKETSNQKMNFYLSAQKNENTISFNLLAEGKISDPNPSMKEGTGIKYIKARLQESYDEKWSFSSGPTVDGWTSKIVIPRN